MRPLRVTGLGILSGLGNGVQEHLDAVRSRVVPFRPLGEILGSDSEFAQTPGAWIKPRKLLSRNRYGPTTNLCLHVAKQAVDDAGLNKEDLKEAAIIVGSSRGNCAGWLDDWPDRLAHKKMAASNTMHSEMGAALSIHYGIEGPYHILANGCSSGLDAIGLAQMLITCGQVSRALVVGADLPIVPSLLKSYQNTGLITTNQVNDPYGPETTGFIPGEAGAALILEGERDSESYGTIDGYWSNSDAYDALGLPPDGRGMIKLLEKAGVSDIGAICPHASGTASHGASEVNALKTIFGERDESVSLHLLKPFTGHTIGSSGALDMALLLAFMKEGKMPPNLPGMSCPEGPFVMPDVENPVPDRGILKISVGMGGHNAIVRFSSTGVTSIDPVRNPRM